MKDSFIFYRSFAKSLEGLNDDDELAILRAIIKKGLNNKKIRLKGIQKNIFATIEPQIEANNRRYANGLKGAQYGHLGGEYGKLGGRPKKPPINPPNENENVNVNVNVNENGNDPIIKAIMEK